MRSTLRFNKACVTAGVMLGLMLTEGIQTAYAAPTPLSSMRQQKQVRGVVRDKNGNPIPGVNIQVKNTTTGTATGADGKFVISVKSPSDILIFRFIGYLTQEVPAGDQSSIDITLLEDVANINEVVVTALGIRKEARSNGYAVSKVQGADMTKAREISVANGLVGRVAGVNSAPPATGPGGSSRVTIRGNSSLSGANQPLYVVNGIPMHNANLGSAGKWGGTDLGDGISSINPDDIEDMTILKGAAASALYGQRGVNGVILITTKSGKAGQMRVELNSNVTVEKANDFLDFQDVYGQGIKGAKPTDKQSALNSGLSSWGSKLDGSATTLFDGVAHPYSKQGDRMKDFYKTGSTFSNTLSVAGGSDKTTYRVAVGDLRNKGIYPNTEYIRNNVNIDLNYKLSDKFSGQTNVIYTKEITNNRSNLSDAPGNGNYAIAFLPANVAASYLEPGYDAQFKELVYTSDLFSTNPFFAANRFRNNTKKDRVLGVTSLRYTPVPWLFIQARVANDYFGFNATSITPTGTAYRPAGSLDLERNRQFNETNIDALLGINKDITSKLSLSFNAGANLLKKTDKVNDVTASNFAFPFVYNPATAATKNSSIIQYNKEVHSVYGSLELAWNSTLYLNVTDRNDWSSTLPKQNNSYNYPSVSASYVFSETIKTNWLSFGKLRAGFAQVGGDADEYKTALYYSTLGNTINGVPLGEIESKIPNSALKPLKVKEVEVGAEVKLLDNRIFADFSWYNKQASNDIVTATVSSGSGYTSALVNVGKLENRGIEVMVGGTPVKSANFSWTTTFNFAHNKNKVIQLAEGQGSMLVEGGESRTEDGFINHVVGLPYSQIMVYDFKRNEKGEMIVDASGIPQRTDALIAQGTGVAPYTGGWSNEVSYGRLHLSFLIDFKAGGKIYSGTNANAYSYGLHKETLAGREGGVVVTGVTEGGEAKTTTIVADDYYNRLASISALQVYKSDFIKFRSLALTYDFSRKALHEKLNGISISLVGRNLFYFKKSTPNIDPESNYSNSNAQGLEYAGLPTTRSFGVNLNVKF
ncbi:SusC/RagA family TonB-linked outer membrane protein [Chitinophaga rhizophila]|uniref:SusC/RagA family TonB-linked outer membrane protein n=1 Tax=Chitinophaga rhizophila TaxID=2866212 RepID=A0ABS7G8R7_9BACT|nr:SusC/RagA family TonB-linked outer membrane protein [Chitinophaga rhizophila]MBW8684057.1 SusC/RagA family TonB-linked outer membrane protein [Chitinophaga rhizophila]